MPDKNGAERWERTAGAVFSRFFAVKYHGFLAKTFSFSACAVYIIVCEK